MIIDTSALVAIILKEPDAHFFDDCIRSASARLMSMGNCLELMLVLSTRLEIDARELVQATITEYSIIIVPIDDAQMKQALHAAAIYGRGRHRAKLNFGDCFAYALAKTRREPLLFKGNDFSQTDVVSVA